MTTKEQERKALEQIKKILAGLGDHSYIGTAMAGMIEDAEENIECDFAMSWKDRAETERRIGEEQRNENVLLRKQNDELACQLAEAKRDAEEAKEDIETLRKYKDEYKASMNAEYTAKIEAQNKVEELELEIMKLKAKLYDLITK